MATMLAKGKGGCPQASPWPEAPMHFSLKGRVEEGYAMWPLALLLGVTSNHALGLDLGTGVPGSLGSSGSQLPPQTPAAGLQMLSRSCRRPHHHL